jgi:hypothetical protein
MALDSLLYWKHKQPLDNQWRPVPGQASVKLPGTFEQLDVKAMVVDAAPIVGSVAAATHISQVRSFGTTASANPFTNVKTVAALNRAATRVPLLLLLCQAADLNYRTYIPRWANERELERDEESVREHVGIAMENGAALYLTRMICKLGAKTFRAPVDILVFGAFGDMVQRNFVHTPAV